MKTLLIIRHAKSSWENDNNDFDRPLNDRGKRDAPGMAKRLMKAGIRIDLFVSSPAKRAKATAEFFAREYGRSPEEIVFIPELYHAEVQAFKDAVAVLDDRFHTVAIFSHNPGITAFANSLTSVRLDNIPTCGIFAVTSLTTEWKEFSHSEKTFWFFDYPKSLEGS